MVQPITNQLGGYALESLSAHRRHDISDHVRGLPEPHLPGRKGQWGGVAKDNRLFAHRISLKGFAA